jgi:hypothetical protein
MKDPMTKFSNLSECQLGFDALLTSAEEANTTRQQERACARDTNRAACCTIEDDV